MRSWIGNVSAIERGESIRLVQDDDSGVGGVREDPSVISWRVCSSALVWHVQGLGLQCVGDQRAVSGIPLATDVSVDSPWVEVQGHVELTACSTSCRNVASRDRPWRRRR